MLLDTTAPVAHVQPAEQVSGFATGLKTMSDRLESLREKAAIVGFNCGSGFINGWQEAQIEKLYAQRVADSNKNDPAVTMLDLMLSDTEKAEYDAWVDAVNEERTADFIEATWGGPETDPIYADLASAAKSPVSVIEEEPLPVAFAADHADDQPSSNYRPELIEEPQEREVYTDSDGKRYTQW